MIPNTKIREVASKGVVGAVDFGISANDTAFVMTILRDSIYTDKIQAVLREYSANAWDAHRDAGKGDLPIRVHVPTDLEPVLKIRDFGKGLSHEMVFDVFTQYGRSTKRESAEAVGMLGIGSKSGFAYSDSFTIVSYHGGTKSTYVAALDASDKGVMNLLHTEDCGDETGIEIQIAVKMSDIYEFQTKASALYQYFNPRPEINIELPANEETHTPMPSGAINKGGSYSWVAVMGCIAYRINIYQLSSNGFDTSRFSRMGGVLYFNVGELQFNASREELKYTDATKQAVVDKFHSLTDEFLAHILSEVENSNLDDWQKRLKGQILNDLGIPLPNESAEVFARFVPIKKAPVSFSVIRNRDTVHSFGVTERTRLLLCDDKRAIKGFHLNEYDYLIKRQVGAELDDVEKELETVIKNLKVTGIPVVKLSTLPWEAPKGKRGHGSADRSKHHVRNFRLIPASSFYRPYSDNWETEAEREASDTDVFVILANFKADYNFYFLYQQDQLLAKAFGKDMPEIYGYKSTSAKPVKPADVEGTEYLAWRKEFHKSLATDDTCKLMNNWVRAYSTDRSNYNGYYGAYGVIKQKEFKAIEKALGEDHAITVFVKASLDGQQALKTAALPEDVIKLLAEVTGIGFNKTLVQNELAAIRDKYPLLTLREYDVNALWSDNAEKFLDYVNLVDKNS